MFLSKEAEVICKHIDDHFNEWECSAGSYKQPYICKKLKLLVDNWDNIFPTLHLYDEETYQKMSFGAWDRQWIGRKLEWKTYRWLKARRKKRNNERLIAEDEARQKFNLMLSMDWK